MERYWALSQPFQQRPGSKSYLAVIFVCAVMMNIGSFFEFDVNGVATPYEKNHAVYMITIIWVELVAKRILPFLCLALLNCGIVVNLTTHQSELRRKTSDGSQMSTTHGGSTEHTTTVLLIGIVGEFFICQILFLITKVTLLSYPSSSQTPLWIYFLKELGDVFNLMNSSLNFIVYCMVGKKFRMKLWRLLGCKNESR